MNFDQAPLGNKGNTSENKQSVETTLASLAESVEGTLRVVKEHEKTISWVQSLTYFGFLIVMLMVAGMLIDSWTRKEESVEKLQAQLNHTLLLEQINNVSWCQ